MGHDVFISHAHKDKGFATAICEKLESTQIKCWIAERDITAGHNWTEATRNAIGSSRVMVLMLSENANAAAHIEREIAHAFYTGRIIIPLRLTNTIPRRDFLFYLGSVRWFDAFKMPAEEQMEALAESIHGLVRGPNTNCKAISLPPEIKPTRAFDFSDSWIGALQASHYRTLETLKHLAIGASLVAVLWLSWFALQQTKQEIPPAMSDPQATVPQPGAALDKTSKATGEAPASKPAYVYSRFGLWVAPNAPSTSDQHAPLELPSTTAVEQPASAPTSPLPDADQPGTGQSESLGAHGGPIDRSAERDHLPRANRQEWHRSHGKKRPKSHGRRVPASEGSLSRRIQSGLKSAWRQIGNW